MSEKIRWWLCPDLKTFTAVKIPQVVGNDELAICGYCKFQNHIVLGILKIWPP